MAHRHATLFADTGNEGIRIEIRLYAIEFARMPIDAALAAVRESYEELQTTNNNTTNGRFELLVDKLALILSASLAFGTAFFIAGFAFLGGAAIDLYRLIMRKCRNNENIENTHMESHGNNHI